MLNNKASPLSFPSISGALRELRKDASFMADVRDKERAKVDAERLGNEKRWVVICLREVSSLACACKQGGKNTTHTDT